MIAELPGLFAAPTAAVRPMMFWVWNGEVTRERIDGDIADMKAKGVGGFFIHPMGEHFRLQDFLIGISPAYLSDEYFELVRYAVERAKAEGLYAWLYDEGGWPSGTAQGKVVEGHPELCGKVLTVVQGGTPPEGTVATVVLRDGAQPEMLAPGASAPTADAVVLHFVPRVGGYPVDMMDPAAVRRFIEVTHERYRQYVGEHFGTTIPGVFTDEGRVGGFVGTAGIPWTPGMLAAFESDHGCDLRPWLPVLFAPEALGVDPRAHYPRTNQMAVRCAFFDTWTRLHREAFYDQVNAWCREHQLLHVGHVGGEDRLADHLGGGFGEFFRTAGALDVPGVDAIWRQLWPGQANGDFPRLASSAAHQKAADPSLTDWPRSGLALTESFGVYGFGLTYRDMKWVTDYQFVRGINVMCPMSRSMFSDRGRVYRTLDDLGPLNPLWQHYQPYADYVGRLSVMCRAGDPVAGMAVYYPIETLWASVPGEAEASFEAVCGLLGDQQLDFDVIGGDALLRAVVEEELLVTPGAQYELLIVPEVSVLRRSIVDKLIHLRSHGGRIVFLGDGPEWVVEGSEARPVAEAAPELLEGAYVVALPREIDHIAPAFGGLSSHAAKMTLDGLVPAFFGGEWLERFAGHRLAPGVVLKVPPHGLGPFAQVLGMTAGRVRLSPVEPIEGVRMMTRVLEQTSLHFLVNERDEEAACRFSLAAEEPLRVETWDPKTGVRATLAYHDEVEETTELEVTLAPFGSVILVATVPELLDDPGEPEPEPNVSLNVGTVGPPRPVSGVEIRDGAIVPRTTLPSVTAEGPPPEEGRWDLIEGCEDFSGTMEYRMTLAATPDWLDRRVILELHEVRHAAELWVNDQHVGRAIWPPYEWDIAPFLREGDNDIRIHITNTLANQALRPDVIEQAKAKGWWNVYCERAEPMMRESLPSGMDPAVTLWLGD